MAVLPDPSLTCWARRDSQWSSVEKAGVSGFVTCQSTSPWRLLGSPMPPCPAANASMQAFTTSLGMAALFPLPSVWSSKTCLHQCILLLKNSLLTRNHKILCLASLCSNICLSFLWSAWPTCSCLCLWSALPRKTPPTARSCSMPKTRSVSQSAGMTCVLNYLTHTNTSHFKLSFSSSVDFTHHSFIPSIAKDKLRELRVRPCSLLHAPWYCIYNRCSVR